MSSDKNWCTDGVPHFEILTNLMILEMRILRETTTGWEWLTTGLIAGDP